MFSYQVKYHIEPASWHINEVVFYCKAWTKYGAWKKWLKETKDERHYACYEYRHSYRRMRHDIIRERR